MKYYIESKETTMWPKWILLKCLECNANILVPSFSPLHTRCPFCMEPQLVRRGEETPESFLNRANRDGKKYVMTNDTKKIHDHFLRRIMYCRDIRGCSSVGDGGGFIESENNFPHDTDAYINPFVNIMENASVSGNANVCGNVTISRCGQICENATVRGNLYISDSAKISGCAYVDSMNKSFHSVMIENSTIDGSASVIGQFMMAQNAKIGKFALCNTGSNLFCFLKNTHIEKPIIIDERFCVNAGFGHDRLSFNIQGTNAFEYHIINAQL